MLAAAGSGARLGAGGPKALVELAGRPLIGHCAAALAAAASIRAVVIAVPPGVEEGTRSAFAAAAPELEVEVVVGGATRAGSVVAALAAVVDELVVIHDAARPLTGPELLDAIVARLAASEGIEGVIAAAPINDTVKHATSPRPAAGEPGDPAEIAGTLDRSVLWAAQTPQAFRTSALRDAQAAARDRGELEAATDEATLIERAGGRVLIEPAPPQNLKITTARDLAIAESLLAARPPGAERAKGSE